MSVASILSREEFVGWLGGSPPPSPKNMKGTDLPSFKSDDVVVWWPTSSDAASRTSAIIVVNDASMANFLAFTATYVRSYVPFTAFFRVLPLRLFARFLSLATDVNIKDVQPELVGILIAEASLQVGERARSIDDLSIQSCRATFSSAVLQALVVGYDSSVVTALARNWGKAHAVLSGEPLRHPLTSLEEFWSTLAPVVRPSKEKFEPPSPINSFLKGVLARREPSQNAWQNVVKDIPEIADALLEMQGSREDRVRSFDRYIKLLASSERIDPRIRSISAGLLMASVAHGSFRYLRLLGQYEEQLPAARLWFAFFAGLHPSTDVFHESDCLGRQLTRHLQPGSISIAPDADIAVDELFILATEKRTPRFRTEFSTVATVEILPGVNARFRQHRESDRMVSGSRPASADTREIRALLDRALVLVDRMSGGRSEVQADLFKPSKGKGAKSKSER